MVVLGRAFLSFRGRGSSSRTAFALAPACREAQLDSVGPRWAEMIASGRPLLSLRGRGSSSRTAFALAPACGETRLDLVGLGWSEMMVLGRAFAFLRGRGSSSRMAFALAPARSGTHLDPVGLGFPRRWSWDMHFSPFVDVDRRQGRLSHWRPLAARTNWIQLGQGGPR